MNNPPTQNRIMRFFSNPVVGMIGTAASVISIPLALFFYLSEQRTRDLSAFVHPVRTTVVRTGQASKMSVKFEDRLIDSDVTAVQIAVWNRGALPIRPTNVLKPVAITMPGRQILEATIKKQSRDVVNFRLDTTKLAEGRVPLNWDILEKDDGAVLQLIYAGDNTSDINCEGILEGQASVSRPKYPRTILQPEELLRENTFIRIFLYVNAMLLAIAFIAYTMMLHHSANLPIPRRLRYMFVAMGALFACGTILAMCWHLTQYGAPPFGF